MGLGKRLHVPEDVMVLNHTAASIRLCLSLDLILCVYNYYLCPRV